MIRKVLNLKNASRCLLLALALLPVFSAVEPAKIYADHTCPHFQGVQLYGRDVNCGYFLNSYVDVTGAGLLTNIGSPWTSEALWEVGDVNTFIAVIRYHLQGCNFTDAISSQRRNAAAFIILTMQGAPAGTVANAPCLPGNPYHVNNWENLVRQYVARGLVDFNPGNANNYSYGHNTRLQKSTQDIAWYYANDTRPSIVFRRPGGGPALYAIKKDCANPVGIPGALVPLDRPTTIVCNPAILTVEAGQSFTLNVSFHTINGDGPPVFYNIRVYDLQEAGVTNGSIAAVFAQVARSGGTGSGTLPNIIQPPPTLRINTPGVYPSRFVVEANDAINSGESCPIQITVTGRPYHRVHGGDVSVGGGFEGATSCAVDAWASIIGTNRGSSPHTGSGSQLAAFALDVILDFATGQVRTGATDPNHLSFANNSPDGNTPWPLGLYATYGGGLHPDNAICAPDYYAQLPPTAVPVPSNPFTINPGDPSNVYRHTGDLRITSNPVGVGQGRDITIYVDGNAFIEGAGIRYQQGGGYASAAQIPSFRLIVRGNIYVEPTVTEMSGLYVAQGNTSSPNTTGRFYSCASRAWSGRTPNYVPTDAEMAGSSAPCRANKLRVYGAVIADLIKLTRTNGTLANSSTLERGYNNVSDAAEIFIFSPEVWLNGELPRGSGDFDAVIPLPPVL